MRWRYDNYHDSFAFDVQEYLESRDITLSEIIGVIFMVKRDSSDPDVDALVTLTLGSGIALLPRTETKPDRLVITFDETDFGAGALEVNDGTGIPYKIGLGLKVTGMSKYLELDPEDKDLYIYEDFIHD